MAEFYLNGSYFSVNDPVLKISNRSFCYGDAIFETTRMFKSNLIFLSDHLTRLNKGMKLLQLHYSVNIDQELLSSIALELAKKNNIQEGGRLRLQVFRDEAESYLVTGKKASLLITLESAADKFYLLNEKGLTLELYEDIQRNPDILSPYKTSNKLPFILAALHMQEKKADDCLLLNTSGNVAESLNSNVFIVKSDKIFTPPVSEGCIDGVMRKNIIKLATQQGKSVEEKPLQIKDLVEADEILLSNVMGIKWVGAFRERRYFSKTAREITDLLNQRLTDTFLKVPAI